MSETNNKVQYTITVFEDQCTVTKPGFYCATFYGRTFKADAIRYVLARGGAFHFENFDPNK